MHHEKTDTTLTVTFEEDILSTNTLELKDALVELLNLTTQCNAIRLDLSAVDIIDSQGLNLLIGIYQECQKRQWQFTVHNPKSNVRELLQFVRLEQRFGLAQI